MSTTLDTQMTAQGLLIPYTVIRKWKYTDLEIIKTETGILIRPKEEFSEEEAVQYERALDMQILQEAGLISPRMPLLDQIPSISTERQSELARKFSVGKPLSEIIIEEREDRA